MTILDPDFKQTDKVQAYEVAHSIEKKKLNVNADFFFVLKTKLRQILFIYLIIIY